MRNVFSFVFVFFSFVPFLYFVMYPEPTVSVTKRPPNFIPSVFQHDDDSGKEDVCVYVCMKKSAFI